MLISGQVKNFLIKDAFKNVGKGLYKLQEKGGYKFFSFNKSFI